MNHCRTGILVALLFAAPVRAGETGKSGSTDQADSAATTDAKRPAEPRKPYSPEVVAKAEQILSAAGLSRTGTSVRSLQAADLSRALTKLGRQRRELRLVQDRWRQAARNEANVRQTLRQLNGRYGDLNLQLAAAAGADAKKHNQIVAMINATAARAKQIAGTRDQAKRATEIEAAKVRDAEAEYAEVVLAIRADYDDLKRQLSEKLKHKQVQTALAVMNRNHDVPADLTAETILASVTRRLEKVEGEVFRESIPLKVDSGGLFVPVTVDGQTTTMVVDSGASIISLPARVAAELRIKVPADAPRMRMALADGRVINARGVLLDRVRVGQFEAERVEAAILDASADAAEPLLGMSFLGRFKFEIDTANRSLKLLRVDAGD